MTQVNAFTFGNTPGYAAEFAKGKPFHKLGRHQEDDGKWYEGGIVFRSPEEAQAYLGRVYPDKDYTVYGLVLPNGWDTDVHGPLPGDDFQRILNDALLVDLGR